MLAVAQFYQNPQCQQAIDQQYGDDVAEFFAQAIETMIEFPFIKGLYA